MSKKDIVTQEINLQQAINHFRLKPPQIYMSKKLFKSEDSFSIEEWKSKFNEKDIITN